MEKYFDLLLGTPLFADIERDDLSSMLNCMGAKIINLQKSTPVFLEGSAAGFVGLVLEGSIQIVHDDFYGKRSVLSIAERRDLFAEAFACANVDTMPVSGYATKESKVMLLSCKRMLTVCSNACRFHNQLVNNLLKVVAQRNLYLNNKITYMSQKTTKETLMSFLLAEAKRFGNSEFTIPFDRQALADFLGVERSAMSAELSKLRKAGVLDCKGSWFRLIDPEQVAI